MLEAKGNHMLYSCIYMFNDAKSLIFFLQCLQHKAFNPDAPLPPIEKHLLDMLGTPQEVADKCQAPLEKLNTLFPLKDVGKIKEQKTAQHIFKDK